MASPLERRSPERQRHLLGLLRRIAMFSLLLSLALLLAPVVGTEFGWLGPSVADRIAEAERAMQVARSYGADDTLAPVKAAESELHSAREEAAQGKHRAARHAAARAAEHAVEAQRLALVRGQETQRRAEQVVDDLDREVNELEDLYEQVTPGLHRSAVSPLLARMRQARRTAAVVFLAKDEKRFADVLEGEAAARQALAETRAALEAARR
jgi:hypothetical protein